jgi:hypothetical protein
VAKYDKKEMLYRSAGIEPAIIAISHKWNGAVADRP